MIFVYPSPTSQRRHGPSGYAKYETYRPWLRDEFCFRCAYCLKRENWTQVVREFEIDHLQPQSLRPDKATSYNNLVYACSRCNGVKSGQSVSDPFFVFVKDKIKILENGKVEGISREAIRLVLQLDLNSDLTVQWRKFMLEYEKLARNGDSETRKRLVGFPDQLPNLRKRRPSANSRPGGIDESWYAKRERDELPKKY